MPPGGVLATGRLAGDRVAVDDAAGAARLLSKGAVGTQRPVGTLGLDLDLAEAAWCVAEGRLAVADGATTLGFADLLARGAAATQAEYLAYRDLRERGLVARATPAGHLAVWPRGADSGEPAFHLRPFGDGASLGLADLAQAAGQGDALAVVDADGAVTHYQASLAAPAGDVPAGDLPRAKGIVLADRVLVADAAAAKAYHQREFVGTLQGSNLFLSFVEAEALRRRGVLAVPAGVAENGEARRLLPAHLALRAAGVVPKSGLKFGTHLRAYRGAPDDGHAEWLVHCAIPGEDLAWSAVARGVRLAHGVRKEFLVAIPGDDGGVRFARLAWFRP